MGKKAIFVAIGIALLVAGVYAYFLNVTREQPEPGEEGGEAPDYPSPGFPDGNEAKAEETVEIRNFKITEFYCYDRKRKIVTPVPEQYYGNVYELMRNLQVLRDYLGVPISINSGYRTPEHNADLEKEGAAKNSFHMKAMAGDLHVWGKSPKEVKAAIELLISQGKMKQGGVGLYKTFVHYDVRGTRARWEK